MSDGTKARSVRETVLDLLRALEMTTVFGNPGSTELPFLQDWPGDLRYVLALQEASAVAMADGYAQATGRAAFVNLHSAAGVGNALGSVFTAFRNQTPLVITAGQQVRGLMPYDPYLGADRASEFPRPYVKWSCEPLRAQDVPVAIAQAHAIASQHPRGPTFVSIPSDDWGAASAANAAGAARSIAPIGGADTAALAAFAGVIARSARPALVVGAGVDRDGAYDAAVALAGRMNAAVWEAPNSSRSSFPQDHPLFAGFLPAVPERLSQALEPFDLILVVGAPVFTFHVAGEAAILSSGVPVLLLTDDADAAAHSRSTGSALGALRPSIEALTTLLPAATRAGPQARRVPPPAPAGDPMTPDFVMQEIARAIGRDTVVVEEAPSHRPAMQRRVPISRSGGFFTMASGGLGWGMPAAVGVAMATGRRVACLVGDGSAMYSVQAMWTAAQAGLPVTFIVLNNRSYGAMLAFSRLMQQPEPPGVRLPGIAFLSLAEGFGLPASSVAGTGDLFPALEAALARPGPSLVEVTLQAEAGDIY